MARPTLFITGTDTGVGKTVLTRLLAGYLHARGERVTALKPVCSGGRADARQLREALGKQFFLNDINPWYFKAASAPTLAAQREGKAVTLAELVDHAQSWRKRVDWLLIEGAGGLLSPLVTDGDSRDLLLALKAVPVVVGSSRLGVINHLRLTLAALPPAARAKAMVVLMSPAKPDTATRTNAALLGTFMPPAQIFCLPWFGTEPELGNLLIRPEVRLALDRILGFESL